LDIQNAHVSANGELGAEKTDAGGSGGGGGRGEECWGTDPPRSCSIADDDDVDDDGDDDDEAHVATLVFVLHRADARHADNIANNPALSSFMLTVRLANAVQRDESNARSNRLFPCTVPPV
jgi:hypothetical protein